VRSSVDVESAIDHSFVATVRLAQGGDRQAAAAIDAVRSRWLEEMGRHIDDPALALAITLIGDGLYYHSALRAEVDASALETDDIGPAQMDGLVALLERIAQTSR